MSPETDVKTPIRLLRPVGPPLGLYLRPGRNDHHVLIEKLLSGTPNLSGLVFDPCQEQRHKELLETAQERQVETVLDPKSVELATEGGLLRTGVASLPWHIGEAAEQPSQIAANKPALAEGLANHLVRCGYSAVLAPTHYLKDARDPWLAVDREVTIALRRALDASGRRSAPIYYPLVVSGPAFRSWSERRLLKEHLSGLPIDAVWLRIHGFGTTSSGPQSLRGYIEAGRDLHSLNVPLVADRTGSVGLALLAFGAVGGIESGITLGERFDFGDLKKQRDGDKPFAPQARVYIADLGCFLTRKQATQFFELRGMKAKFGCRDTDCCRRGVGDTLRDPRPHFLNARPREVEAMGRLPEDLRASNYLDEFLRPATDLALTASRVFPEIESTRVRLERWRTTLGAIHRERPAESFAIAPNGERVMQRSA